MQRLAIHSVPRSGSTWLGALFDSSPRVLYRYQPLFSYAFKGRLSSQSSAEEIKQFFHDIGVSKDDFINQTEAKVKGIVPTFSKHDPTTVIYKEVRYHNIVPHLLTCDEQVKIIGLVRNPLSTLNSWLNAPKEFRPDLGWKIQEEWQLAPRKNQHKPEEFNGYEKWKEVALMFEALRSQYPERFFLVQYQDLLNNLDRTVQALFEFAEIPVESQTRTFLKESRIRQSEDAYGVYHTQAK